MNVLDWQKNGRIIQKMAETSLVGDERAMLKEQWKKEEEHEREMERQRFIVNRERNLELIRHNEAEQTLKD
jgi:hypothetical protein